MLLRNFPMILIFICCKTQWLFIMLKSFTEKVLFQKVRLHGILECIICTIQSVSCLIYTVKTPKALFGHTTPILVMQNTQVCEIPAKKILDNSLEEKKVEAMFYWSVLLLTKGK